MSVTYISTALRDSVYERAQGLCEYCLIDEEISFAKHQIDHVIAEKHGGETVEENLALSCAICNKYKGSDIVFNRRRNGRNRPAFQSANRHLERTFQN